MRKTSNKILVVKNKSVQSYLDTSLYPTLQKAVDEVHLIL